MAQLRSMTALVVGMALVMTGHVSGAAQSTGLDGAVRHGTCDILADQVSDRSPTLLALGEPRGSSDAIPAANSFSTIPIPLEALLAEDHVVTAADPEGDVIACGEVGGLRTDGGELIIGLRSVEESALTGIAYLAPSSDASQTDVSLFIAGESLATMGVPQVGEVVQEGPEALVEGGGLDVLLTPLPRAEPDVAAPVAEQPTGFSLEEAAYADAVVEITQSMRESFEDFSALVENPRFGQDDWTIQVATQFVIWDSNYQEAPALTPPPVFAETHALFIEALRLYSEAGDDAALGFDTLDPAMINQGASKMDQGTELIGLASEEVTRIRQERGE